VFQNFESIGHPHNKTQETETLRDSTHFLIQWFLRITKIHFHMIIIFLIKMNVYQVHVYVYTDLAYLNDDQGVNVRFQR